MKKMSTALGLAALLLATAPAAVAQGVSGTEKPQPKTEHPNASQGKQGKQGKTRRDQATGHTTKKSQDTERPKDAQGSGERTKQAKGTAGTQRPKNAENKGAKERPKQAQAKDTPVVRPKDGEVVRPQDTPVVRPKDGEVVRPQDTPVVRPKDGEVVRPKDAPVVRPKDGEVVRPKDAPVVRPKDGEVVRPKDAAAALPPNYSSLLRGYADEATKNMERNARIRRLQELAEEAGQRDRVAELQTLHQRERTRYIDYQNDLKARLGDQVYDKLQADLAAWKAKETPGGGLPGGRTGGGPDREKAREGQGERPAENETKRPEQPVRRTGGGV